MNEEPGRFMVLSETGSVTTAAALNIDWREALRIARDLRAGGLHVHIMRTDTECATCVVKADEELPER